MQGTYFKSHCVAVCIDKLLLICSKDMQYRLCINYRHQLCVCWNKGEKVTGSSGCLLDDAGNFSENPTETVVTLF